ncbi:uncharacterized protein LOC119012232 [Acanthopagrus latus]|uniref:uncharacterized protein LOC119012232 n=1 Tax=Acanthopagrus latus TaxID=8177 RepID=UPI00187C2C3B|nr:uncharacterized protein LOC119012232 [Acanthopagrus latus]
MMTERQFLLSEDEGISRMDRNNMKDTDQQEVQTKASVSQQAPSRKLTSGIQRPSSAPSMVVKDEGTQLETFQSLTFQPERCQKIETLQDFCSGPYNPQSPQESQRNIQTDIQAQAEVFSMVHSQGQTDFNTPLLHQPGTPPFQVKGITEIPDKREREGKDCQLQRWNTSRKKPHLEGKEKSNNPQSTQTENRFDQLLSQAKASIEKRGRHQETENKPETAGEIIDKEKVKGQFEFMVPHGKRNGATSEDRWEQSLQQNNTHVWTPKHPSTAYESHLVQHFNIFPLLRDNRVSPRAWGNQEVIVSFETMNDHMERLSSLNVETLSTSCDETQTRLLLCQCINSKPGSNTGSNWVKGGKQATTTAAAAAAFCLGAPNHTSQAPTPLKHSTFPMHSTIRSTSGCASSSEEDNPPSQCHQFPKLPSPPPRLGLQESHLNQSEDGSPSQSEEGWMFPRIQSLKQDQSLQHQQHSSPFCSNTDDRTHDGAQKLWKADNQCDSKMTQTSQGFPREIADEKDELQSGCEGDNFLSDREGRQAGRNLHNLRSREVQVLRQQMEALQQQFKQREGDWLLVRCQVDELIRENAKLKKKLTVAPQRDPVAARCSTLSRTAATW